MKDEEKVFCPVLDARRSQVYAGAYSGIKSIVKGGPYMLDEFLGMVRGCDDLIFAGDGLSPYGERIRAWADREGKNAEIRQIFQSADDVALYAYKMAEGTIPSEGRCGISYEEMEPQYMRMAEAEKRLKDGTLSKKVR